MCVLCWNLLKDYVLKLMVFDVCILCNLLKDYVLKLMVSMCVLLELSDNLYVGVVTLCVVCVHAKKCVVQRICDLLPKLSLL